IDGVANAIEAARWLKKTGHQFLGIRLDSGDLAYLSVEARKMLDDAGFEDAAIVASNDLDEHIINSLNAQNAKISVWGVGTKLVTAYDQPALGCVYKLAAVKDAGQAWKYKVKISEQAVKISNPGIQQVRRFMDEDGYLADMIFNVEENLKSECIIVDPLDMTRRKRIGKDCRFHDLLEPIFLNGRQVYDIPTVQATRHFVREQLENFHATYKRILNPHQYPVGLEIGLHELKTDLILKEREQLQVRKDAYAKSARKKKLSNASPEDVSTSKINDVIIKARTTDVDALKQKSITPPPLPVSLERSALIIVDAQKGFGSSGELPVPRAEEIVGVINKLIDKFPLVVATQDWHPADHISFAINHANKRIGDTFNAGLYEQPLFPMHCIENTRGSEFLENLRTEKINRIFKKGSDPDIDCFSGFNDCAGGKATDMEVFLKDSGIEHIFVTGLATNYCVKQTALDGVKLGFRVTLIEDAVRGIDRVGCRVKTAIQEMKDGGVAFVRSEEMNYPTVGRKTAKAKNGNTNLSKKGKL
ncbi:MAG: isochorismatase family protein, partial [Candidatus Melainabacteria bacterium]|nr:isochorismatase family protein [Candidatus Melainabacteria bacterium]